ncbi:MAG: Trk system potassium transporter TrkA [Proteobacteria bacterium]|nr:Trk system potassium transporter TrkA [Pseudomonadota bacterium]MBU4469569.1 Trk system potassium transporter TrkA [Pseudomonadota bacterium]MCG2753247.1 Trk system potassium transporter TrkA [Desulfobacteraceae bacterium]
MKIVIVGAGEVGFHIASHLARENKDVVVIDQDAAAIRRLSENIDVQVIQASGSSPAALMEAGIKSAELMLAVTNSDETNLVACLVSDMLSPNTKKLARIRAADFDEFHETFKIKAPRIETVINPEIEVVKTIVQMMSVPGAVDVGEFADGRVKLIGVRLEKHEKAIGIPLSELSARVKQKAPLISAIIREDKLIIPRGNDKLLAGDLVYFMSEDRNLTDYLSFFDKHSEPVKRVLIIGGGRIGYRLARLLEDQPVYTKIIEKNSDRCKVIADKLNKAVILHGDGSDQMLLSEENIHEMDMVVALTGEEETNILSSLLVKQMGAKKTITMISRFSYFPLMERIGLDQIVSPRLSAINSILQHIRRGKVLSARSIKGEEAEVLEAMAMETSDIVDKPLNVIGMPKGSLVTGIIRDDQFIIPSGSSIIKPGDRIIIFAVKQAIPKIEKILAVKLEFF